MPTFQNTLFRLHRQGKYEGGTEWSETSAYIIQTPGNYPEESIYKESGASVRFLYRSRAMLKIGTLAKYLTRL